MDLKSLAPIPGYTGYFASENGVIYSIKHRRRDRSPRALKPIRHPGGYHLVIIRQDGGKLIPSLVHRLVMLAFVGPSELTVNHKDFVKTNNHLDNLEYVTMSENNQWNVINGVWGGRRRQYDWAQVLTVLTLKPHIESKALSEYLGCSHSVPGMIYRGKTYKCFQKFVPSREKLV